MEGSSLFAYSKAAKKGKATVEPAKEQKKSDSTDDGEEQEEDLEGSSLFSRPATRKVPVKKMSVGEKEKKKTDDNDHKIQPDLESSSILRSGMHNKRATNQFQTTSDDSVITSLIAAAQNPNRFVYVFTHDKTTMCQMVESGCKLNNVVVLKLEKQNNTFQLVDFVGVKHNIEDLVKNTSSFACGAGCISKNAWKD